MMFIYREEEYKPSDENRGLAEIIIGKQRNGPTGSRKLAFIKEFTRFENLEWRGLRRRPASSSPARPAASRARSGSAAAPTAASGTASSRSARKWRRRRARAVPTRSSLAQAASRPKPFDSIDNSEDARVASGIDEFDRVLGGGIVPGSLVLIGGEPGIGKSTLLLQVAHLLGRTHGSVLYVSGEESERQIKLRGERLGIEGGGLFVMAETSLERILEEVESLKPRALVIDSVQTVFSSRFPSAPGSISQVREVATQLLFVAKGRGITTFLIGHVTKDGSLAGPKSLEHIVDTVLYFEGEKRQHHRIVRAVKNRFGAVSELGIFEMTGAGLQPVANPSALFLAERQAGAAGSAVVATMEGTRPMLVEVQALVSPTLVRHAAPDVARNRPQPHQPAAGRAREAGRPRAAGRRRVRERRRRARGRRAGRRPGRRGGRRVLVPQPAGARRTRCCSARSASAGRCAARARRACASGKPRRWASPAACCPPATCPTTPRRGSA